MVVRTIGDVKTEDFILSKGLHVHTDYGVISYDDGHYYPAFERYSGSKRRSQLLDDKGNIISEVRFCLSIIFICKNLKVKSLVDFGLF